MRRQLIKGVLNLGDCFLSLQNTRNFTKNKFRVFCTWIRIVCFEIYSLIWMLNHATWQVFVNWPVSWDVVHFWKLYLPGTWVFILHFLGFPILLAIKHPQFTHYFMMIENIVGLVGAEKNLSFWSKCAILHLDVLLLTK